MSKMEKFKNRLISIACLAVFAVGISLLTIMTVKLIENYNEQQALLAERDKLLEEKENQNNIPEDEDYYTVYVKDNYSIYDKENTIFVFTK